MVRWVRLPQQSCIYHLFVWSNLKFLHSSEWIPLSTQSFLVSYSFCVKLLNSLCGWSFRLHHHHLLFCCVLSIPALIWMVLMASFCAAIRKDTVSLLRFTFVSHVYVFSCEMLLINRLNLPLSCFSPHFCFLVLAVLLVYELSVLFLVAVISPSPCFAMQSSSRSIVESTLYSMLVCPFPSSLIHIVCQRHFWDSVLYERSLVFLFFDPITLVSLGFSSRIIPKI